MMHTTMKIADIEIGSRARRDMGNIQALADSIKAIGLLQPIGVNQANVLVFGERRLRACQHLGWTEIPVWELNLTHILQAEFDENEIRKQFTVSERAALADALLEEEKVAAKERQGTRADLEHSGQLTGMSKKGEARDFAARRAGLSSEATHRRAKTTITHGIPELVEAMDKEEVTPYRASIIAMMPKENQPHELKKTLDKEFSEVVPRNPRRKDNVDADTKEQAKPKRRGDPNVFNDPEYEGSITVLSTKVMGLLMRMEQTMRRDPVAVEKLRMIGDECNRLIDDIQSWRTK
jgi:ParB-like chromosome segregation protein Spo0J